MKRRDFLKAITPTLIGLFVPVATLLKMRGGSETILAPYTGTMKYDAGYFYCPYIPVIRKDDETVEGGIPLHTKTQYGPHGEVLY